MRKVQLMASIKVYFAIFSLALITLNILTSSISKEIADEAKPN
jgi:hypothetical protein